MLERMLAADDKQAEPAFGVALPPATTELNRERIARERAACIQAAPALFSASAAPSPAPG